MVFNRHLSRRFCLSQILGRWFASGTHELMSKKQEILLLNPSVQRLLNEKRIRFESYDVYNPDNRIRKFDIVRCMNILNPGIFDEPTLLIGLRNIINSVDANGLWIVGRTDIDSGINNATIFRKRNGNMEVMEEFGIGTEIKDLIFSIASGHQAK